MLLTENSKEKLSEENTQSFRQKGKKATGKLVRGFIQDASIKTNISSIPGKFETVIYTKSPKKAFNTTSNRFIPTAPQDLVEVPGPGSYTSSVVGDLSVKSSYSLNGYGNGFLSKTQRTAFIAKYKNMGPGPGSYDPMNTSSISTKISNKLNDSKISFLRSESQEVKQSNLKKKINPGPGSYDPKVIHPGKEHKTYYSSFISKCNREEYLQLTKYPGPGVYETRKTLLEKKPYKILGPYSSFAQPLEKRSNKTRVLIDKLQNDGNSNVEGNKLLVPGPGFYDYSEHKEDFNEGYSSSHFRSGIRNRFGDLLVNKVTRDNGKLGPGYYPTPFGIGKSVLDRNEVSGSVFLSETGRKPFGEVVKKLGPNVNVPYKLPLKKSFLLNLKRSWV